MAAGILTGVVNNAAAWQFGSTGLNVAGPIVMWTGLVIRIWAIVVLGKSFRTTVEVDTGQKMIDSGPYRWVRHPSYTGILLLMVGLSLAYGNWPALAILLVLPTGVLIHRIFVEEAVLTEVIGQRLDALITGPSGRPASRAREAMTFKIASDFVGRSPYDVEGYQLCVMCVKKDSYVLSPASRGEDGTRGDEVIGAGAC